MQFFQWIANNWQTVCAWIGGLYTLYKLGSVVTAVVGFFTSITSRVKEAESTLSLMATNHLPHLQAEMEKVNAKQERTNEILSEIKDDLRLVLFKELNEE